MQQVEWEIDESISVAYPRFFYTIYDMALNALLLRMMMSMLTENETKCENRRLAIVTRELDDEERHYYKQ